MSLGNFIRSFIDKYASKYESIKVNEPDMNEISFQIDTLCHRIRREFERYKEEGIFEIENIYDSTDKIEHYAQKIEGYGEECT